MSSERASQSVPFWKHPAVLRLIIFNVIAIFCIGLMAYWTIGKIRSDVQSDTKASLETVLQTTHEGLHIWIEQETQKLDRIAQSQRFVSIVERLLLLAEDKQNLLESKALRELRIELSELTELSSNQGFFVITPKGRSIGSMRDNNINQINLIQIHRPELFKRAVEGETVFIPPIPSDIPLAGAKPIAGTDTPPTMFFLAPMRNSQGEVIALLSERIDPHGVFSSLTGLGRIGKSGETYLVDKNGYLITESRFVRQLQKLKVLRTTEQDILSIRITDPGKNLNENNDVSFESLRDRSLTVMAKSVIDKRSGVNVEGYRDYRGVEVMGVWDWDHEHDFGMTTEIDVDEALQSYYRARNSIILIVIVAVAIALLFSIISARLNIESERILKRSNDELENEVKIRTRALTENQFRLQTLIDNIPALIYLKTAMGKYELVNQQFLDTTGVEKEKIIGHSDFEIFSEKIAERITTIDRRALRTWSQQSTEESYPTPGGGTSDFLTFKVPLSDSIENENYVLGISMDISERKALESQLISAKEVAESANEIKSNFLASMSHEIRTPMNGIIGMLQLALKTQLTSDQWRKINTALSSAEALLTILNDILDFSKVEAGKMELENFDFNLRELIENTVNSMTVKAHERRLELILDLTDVNQTMVMGDPGRIRQVLLNLISNAIKFSEEGNILVKVALSNATDGQHTLSCSVRDKGIGIPADKIDSMFDLFTQADVTTTRKYGGTGLGLAICKKLVNLMGGDISAASEFGEGSTFTFTAQLGTSQQSEIVAPSHEIAGKHVLVVDDNTTNLEIFLNQLSRWNVDAYPAKSAEEAFQQLENHPIDMVLLDMEMPGKDGIQLATEIRAQRRYSKLRLALMSSVSLESNTVLSDLEFSSYLIKPVTTSDLLDTLTIMAAPAGDSEKPMLVTKARLHALNKFSSDQLQTWDKNSRILIAEDNPVNQQVIHELLQNLGLNCDLADNGEEAINQLLASTQPYDLVFMDCQMPVIDGFKATEAIRNGKAGDEAKAVPIVALTANALQGDREHCLSVGMNDYLTKPIVESEMTRCLTQWLPKSSPTSQPAIQEPVREESPSPATLSQNRSQELIENTQNESIDTFNDALVVPNNLSCFQFKKGLPVLAKRPDSYVRVLQSYLAGGDGFVKRFEELINSQDREKILAEIHAMKGVSGNIGIEPVYETALSLETRIKENEMPLDELHQFNQLVADSFLQAQQVVDANSKPVNPNQIKDFASAKDQLIDQLEHNKYIPEDILTTFTSAAKSNLSEQKVASITKEIHDFNYKTALDILRSA